jgi:photosystem II stability/assembly factor-like uncharacterized protein
VFKSTDAGAHVAARGTGALARRSAAWRSIRATATSCGSRRRAALVAGGERGLYKTTDGGQTWKAVLQISEKPA